MNDIVYDMVLKNCEDITTFNPEVLVSLIGFMLLLEFFGGIFGLFGKMLKVGDK